MFRTNIFRLLRSTTLNKGIKNVYETGINNVTSNVRPCVNNISFKYITSKIHHADKNPNNKLTDEEYLVKIKDDPDNFGPNWDKEETLDEDDLKEEQYLQYNPDPSQKLRTKQYADMIKDLIRKKKIKEAIDVLEVKMLKEDRVKPESYIYSLLLGACGRVGYSKKAFSLYNGMKQRGLKVHPGAYTALFNACANSPWPADGLSRAQHLRNIMIEKGYEPNGTNYNAMIKAFGRCGDLQSAFSLVDEMKTKKLPIKEDTLNFLLQACISDKEAGFRHSLLVWRKFIEKNVKPDLYSYNLLLRCVRDCGIGDIEITKDVINNILKNSELLEESSSKLLLEGKNEDITSTESNNDKLEIKKQGLDIIENRPNLITKVPHLGSILSISEITKPEDRLLLLGGFSGFLKNMQENECKPNIKTFTQLLDSVPSTLAAENDLIAVMNKMNIKPDIDFYNMLIKKRSMRFQYDSAKEVLNLMKISKFRPNVMTYGVLSLGCKTREEAEELIHEMQEAKYRMNPEILGAMLRQACSHICFPYVLYIMEICKEEDIRPNKKFMDTLEEFKSKAKDISNDSTSKLAKSRTFQNGFRLFRMRYKTWKNEVDPVNEEEIHPWQQFRQETETNLRHYKDKESTSRFKPIHLSSYRKKKVVKNTNTKNEFENIKKDFTKHDVIKEINAT